MVIDQSGSTSRSNAPRVALMMPAPIRTTSVFEVVVTLESDTGSLALRVRAVVRVPRLSRGHVSSPGSRTEAFTTAMVTGVTAWETDVLTGYHQHTIELGADPEGEGDLVATLVRRGPAAQARRAVLGVHGYTDYFFNTELAEKFAARGFAFYALDLHKCGRSWREGQTPHFTTDLARYHTELERALAVIAQEAGGEGVCVYGHSAGGLIVTLWLDQLRRRGVTAALGVDGLVLNSPFLDLHGPAILRTAPTAAALIALARLR